MITEQELQEERFSIIGKGCQIEGALHLIGTTHLYATINGNVYHQGEKEELLTIEFGAKINGNITGNNIIILGTINGDIKATGKVVIQPTANITGSIQCKTLLVEPGAVINIKGTTQN